MRIPLTQNKFAIVGPRDYAFLMQWKWSYGNSYAVRTNANNKRIYMHRIILERTGFKNFANSDHINRNRLDNRRCNLRPATDRQSQCNRGKQKNNSSGYIGVSWEKQKRKWEANIKVNRKKIFLGYYNDPKKAAKAHNLAACKYHGQFAVLNEV